MATASLTIVASKEEQELKQRAPTMLEKAMALKVADSVSFSVADAMLGEAATFIKRAKAFCKPFKEAADAAHKAACKQEKDLCEPFEKVRTILNPRCQEFIAETKRQEAEARRRLEEEARKRAEDEHIAAAAQAEKEGDKATAEAILNAPVEVAPIVVPTLVPKASSFSSRENWEVEVIDLKELAKAVAEGRAPVAYILPNESVLKKQANALKAEFNIPGAVRAVRKDISANRSQQ